jgi:hypothetical protein
MLTLKLGKLGRDGRERLRPGSAGIGSCNLRGNPGIETEKLGSAGRLGSERLSPGMPMAGS